MRPRAILFIFRMHDETGSARRNAIGNGMKEDEDLSLDEDFPLGDGVADTEAIVMCPYCGEEVEIAVDPGGGSNQSYVEDCDVCCSPWLVQVQYAGGEVQVSVTQSDA